MNNKFFISGLCMIIMSLPFFSTAQNNEYKKEWAKVDSLESKGLYRMALTQVHKIFEISSKDKNHNQVIKTVFYELKYNTYLEEDDYILGIFKLQDLIAEAPSPAKEILHSLTAEVYWGYYNANSWKFAQRTNVDSEFKLDDVRTWDLKKIAEKVTYHYMMSLLNPEISKKAPIDNFKNIIYHYPETDKFRPTLYDFLAHRAIDFFSANSYNVAGPAETFTINNNKYFNNNSEFLKINVATNDSLNTRFYATKIYQSLTDFHLSTQNKEALFQLELKRLQFVRNNSILSNNTDLYYESMQRLTNTYQNLPLVSEAWYEIAMHHYNIGNTYSFNLEDPNRWEKKKAHEICAETIKKYPDTFGARECKYLMSLIEQKNISFNAELAIVSNELNKIKIQYKNINQIYFKIISYPYNKFTNSGYEQRIKEIQKSKGIIEEVIKFENPGDFHDHTIEHLINKLNYGHYVIVMGSNPDFKNEKEAFVFQPFWVTDLTYQSKSDKNTGNVLVTNRKTGAPVSEAKVHVYYTEYNYVTRKYDSKTVGKYMTNEKGLIEFKGTQQSRSYFFTVEKGDDMFSETSSIYLNPHTYDPVKGTTTRLFTDRKIYRPGQTIYFKGIVTNGKKNDHELLKDYETTVTFYDVNHQKISDLNVKTNEFGSFEGSFIAPFGVLTGNMLISTGNGSTYVQIEEYKRPKFYADFKPIEGEFNLNDSISIVGFAKAFAGNNIDGAEVKYRVTRTTRYNYWNWRWGWYGYNNPAKEIANGDLKSDDNGEFKVKFKTLPDESQNPKYLPIFNYTIYVDVTDINGETHSASTNVSVGYQSLQLGNNIPAEILVKKDLKITLSTTNLNYQKVPAKGNIEIVKLKMPEQIYTKRLWSEPDMKKWSEEEFKKLFPNDEYTNENDYKTWKEEKSVFKAEFDTEKADSVMVKNFNDWKPGVYLYKSTAKDKKGVEVTDVKYFTVINPKSNKPATNDVLKLKDLNSSYQPGETAEILISTAEKDLHVYYIVTIGSEIIEEKWMKLSEEQKLITIPITEKHRGNFNVSVSAVKNNRNYRASNNVFVPFTNKQLNLEFSTFRNKLLPGEKEEWTMTIKNMKGEKEMAELLATLYDASLDEIFTPNSFYMSFFESNYGYNPWSAHKGFGLGYAQSYSYDWNDYIYMPSRYYSTLNYFGYSTYYYGSYYYRSYNRSYDYDSYAETGAVYDELEEVTLEKNNSKDKKASPVSSKTTTTEDTTMGGSGKAAGFGNLKEQEKQEDDLNRNDFSGEGKESNTMDLTNVSARSNFNETAFFYPQLHTDQNGDVKISFTIPESLTKWRFLGLAHTKDLKTGMISEEVITQKDLMVVPNTPRFLREGDEIVISTKISNLSDKNLKGEVKLELYDPFTDEIINKKFELKAVQKEFSVEKDKSTMVSWVLKVPYTQSVVKYKIVAAADKFSDGEENVLPILSNRMLVTESMPMPIRGKENKMFNFKKLQESGKSKTLVHHNLALEFTSNPAWYALQAMPYMMEYPYECAEQTFTRYYSNAIASHIMNGNPKIKKVIEDWGQNSPEAFLSNLQKNQELKEVLLEETPWVLNAKSEEETKRNLSILLDLNRMTKELDRALEKTIKNQSANGGWPWFPGMKENRYITQHIITGMGHLDHLGIKDVKENKKTWKMIEKGVEYLDGEIVRDFEYAKKYDPNYLKNQHIGYTQIQYLYARSYFPQIKMNNRTEKAVEYYKNQAEKYWLSFNIYAEGMIALAAHRLGMKGLSTDIVKSLKDRAIHKEEFGMYWKEYYVGYYWYEAPIETQALMIEMFDEVTNDQTAVEDLKIWLLKEKQTTHWKTTKQTTEAVYALLLKGTDLLASDDLVQISLGGKKIEYVKDTPTNPYQVKPEAGTGYIKTSFKPEEISPKMGEVTIEKTNTGVAWGALYWQYFEDLDKITFAETNLKLKKQLFIVEVTDKGEKLVPINDKHKLKIGDKIRVRIELRTDRNLEYVHMKDMRASGFEPINVISRYKYRDGLGYYEATKDAATNFFFDFIPKGTHVFEYDLRVQHKGDFSNGITTIQCMYAPEFTSHSEGIRVIVE